MNRAFLYSSLLLVACSSSSTSTNGAGDGGTASSSSSSSSSGSTTTSSSGGSSGAGSAGQEDAYCAASASHQTECLKLDPIECQADAKCLYGRLMSKVAADAYNACYAAPSCKKDDDCVDEAGKAAGGAAADAYSTDCQAKVNGCAGASKLLELCSTALYAYPSVVDAAKECLTKSCGELEGCFGTAIQPLKDCK